MNRAVDPESLVAYVDGELEASEAARIETVLTRDPVSRACIGELRDSAALLRGAFHAPVAAPAPDRIAEMIRAASRPEARGSRRGPQGWRGGVWPMAIAACLAAVMVALGGYDLGRYHARQDIRHLLALRAADERAIEAAVSRALEKQVSGVAIEWTNRDSGSRGTVMPVRTFRNTEGRWCREYRETVERDGETETRRAIACREDEGQWRRRAQLLEES